MAESSRRSWPWKKKANDKVASAPASVESSPLASPHNSRLFDEQDVSKVLSDHARVSDEAMTQWQNAELKLEQLNSSLQAALTEMAAKDILVKQHAKVAEEAVTGWEKAEAEAAVLKQQLDTAMLQKLATEDRVSHLDGALKECMKQLRHVREQQEQRIHETIVKKTHEYDKLRQEMEAKLSDIDHELQNTRAEAIHSQGEARALSNALETRTKAFTDVSNAKARADAEMQFLQGRLESTEKENSKLKYELHLQNKEIEIRNEEREYERKVTENVGKDQLEKDAKIVKLEAECQRLRILVRKKLPGPAALAQMKMEVNSLSSHSKSIDPKRSVGRGRSISPSRRDSDFSFESPRESMFPGKSGYNVEVEILTERLAGMHDELKLVKEALARRDEELQSSRIMCAKTSSKLSVVEEQLEAALSKLERKNSSAVDRMGRPRNGCDVDGWDAASALLAELDQIKAVDKGLSRGEMDLMDDFAEIEKLAMVPVEGDLNYRENAEEKSGIVSLFEQKLISKEMELEDAKRIHKELSEHLVHAEEQIASLQSLNSSNEAALITLQEKVDMFCDKQGDDDRAKDRNLTKELEDLVETQFTTLRGGNTILYSLGKDSQDGSDGQTGAGTSLSSSSSLELTAEAKHDLTSVLSDAESKASTLEPDLLTTIQKGVQALEALAQAAGTEHELSTSDSRHRDGAMVERQVYSFMQWESSALDGYLQSLIAISNQLLRGKVDMAEFLSELITVLTFLVNICAGNLHRLLERRASQAEGANEGEKKSNLKKFGSEKALLASHIRSASLGKLGAPKEDDRGKAGVERCSELDMEGMTDIKWRPSDKSKDDVDGLSDQLGGKIHEFSISKSELDGSKVGLHSKVSVPAGGLQGERRGHQEVVAEYLELQQQFCSGVAGSEFLKGSIMKEGPESGAFHN